jgi:hypothetical protein
MTDDTIPAAAHGYGRYTNGCRCEVCRQAKSDYQRRRRAQGRAEAQKHTQSSTGARGSAGNAFRPGATRFLAYVARHGTRYAYEEKGCRCRDCTTARVTSDARYRRGTA